MRHKSRPGSAQLTLPHRGSEDSRHRAVAYTRVSSEDGTAEAAAAAAADSPEADADSDDSTTDECDSARTYTVEEAVEKLGFGRFQLVILLVTGIMSAADAMEMLLLSVLGPALRCEWRLTSAQVAGLTTVVFLGMLVGAPGWGAVSDRQGRRSVFAVALSLIAYFGLLCSFSPNYFWLVCLRGLVGFNIGGAASAFTLLSEYLPQKYRAKALILSNLFWALGSTLEIVLAYLVLPNLGWRYLTAFSALPLIVSLPALSYLPESARFLVASGHPDRAADLIDRIARQNGRPLMKGRPAGVAAPTESKRGQLSQLFHESYRRTTLILFCLWFGVAFLYYGIVLVSAEVFHFRRGCASLDADSGTNSTQTGAAAAAAVSADQTCCRSLKPEDYKAMIVSSLGEFIIIPFLMLTVDSLGRRWTLAINFMLTGLFFGLIYACVPKAATSVLLLLVRAHAGGVFKVAYLYTAEVFPTVVRSVGLGLCSSAARVGSMSAPFVAQVVLPDVSQAAGFAAFAAVGVACALLALLLPIETKGRALVQSVAHLRGDEEKSGDLISCTSDADGSRVTVEIRMQGKFE